ncbi:MAG: outer membrane beta-barrel protein [Alphaproteobacteria bacterium]|nr:outer membrane beta-barrel protein [Alphaproteobacteria bacterium]
MTNVLKSGLASAAVALAAALSAPAMAADLGGSLKDGYVAPMPKVHAAAAGPCYFRADVGGSISRDPDMDWPVYNEVFQGDWNANGVIDADEVSYRFAGSEVQEVSMDNTWLAEIGAGCGSGSRGLRADVTFGFRGERDVWGIPPIYNGTMIGDPVGTPPPDVDDPIHTSIKSYTLMANAYYDFGQFRGFVPYVGAGVGAAYHMVDEVYFTENPFLTNRIEGDKHLSFAWSLMAGVAYQVSDRAILDFGYRYIDMGSASSGRVDSAGFVNPKVELDNIAAHEFKLGLRYHFGSSRSNCCSYAALK